MFKKWPKILRWENETVTVTEKIDGTNACVGIIEGNMFVQSRKNIITPEKDNHGFAAWAEENAAELSKLGEGYHYGEWWGRGINRGYDKNDRVFSLFQPWAATEIPECCDVVPEIARKVKLEELPYILETFKAEGSKAAPGYLRTEGVVLRSTAGTLYKIIWEK